MKIAILILAIIILSSILLITQKQLSEQERFYYNILDKASKAGFSLNCGECSEMTLTDVKGNPYIFYKTMKYDDSLLFFELRANPDKEIAIGIINERINASKDKEDFILTDNLFSYREDNEYVFQLANGSYNFVLRGKRTLADLFLKSIGVLQN